MSSLTTELQSNSGINCQSIDQENQPLTLTNYFQLGSGFLGCIYSFNAITTAANAIAEHLLGTNPELEYDLDLCSYRLEQATIYFIKSAGLFALSASPLLLKRMEKLVEKNLENDKKSAKLELKSEDTLKEKICTSAKGIFFLTTGLGAFHELSSAVGNYAHAGYSYLFNNCLGTLDIKYVDGEKDFIRKYEVCQSSVADAKAHLLAAAILLAVATAPIWIKSAKNLITNNSSEPVQAD